MKIHLTKRFRFFISLILVTSCLNNFGVQAQQTEVKSTNSVVKEQTDDFEIAVFSTDKVSSAVSEKQNNTEEKKAGQNPVVSNEDSDFVVNFEPLPSELLSVKVEDVVDEEFALSVDGEFLPGAKLFGELLEEAEAKRKFDEEEQRKRQEEIAALQNNSDQTNTTSGSTNSYVKKTTTVVTTVRGGGNSSTVGGVANLPSVNASFQATGDAYRLVRLAAMGGGRALPVAWAQLMIDAGKAFSVDPVLIMEVCRQESSFNNNARSWANAHGLMQFIPATAARFGITNSYDPQQAIYGGAKYLRFLLNMFKGEVRSALAGYNAGEGAVTAFLTGRTIYTKNGKAINPRGIRTAFGIPTYEETQKYVSNIYGRYLQSLNRLKQGA